MKTIAEALVYAVSFINLREADDLHDDVRALEGIAAILKEATPQEQDALAAAAERALADERAGPNREDAVQDYASWMEDMFGEDWVGNRRA